MGNEHLLQNEFLETFESKIRLRTLGEGGVQESFENEEKKSCKRWNFFLEWIDLERKSKASFYRRRRKRCYNI